MSKNKFIDCVTFFDNNFMFNLRYNILKKYVDYFVICESYYDHRGNKKGYLFDLNKFEKFNDKIILQGIEISAITFIVIFFALTHC